MSVSPDEPATPTVAVSGTRLACVEIGEGPPVVLVHGSASDHRSWLPHMGAFGAHYRAVTYSRRYHWPNDPIPDGVDYSMGTHVEELRALLQVLGASPAHLVGHSLGGFICLALAMREPGMVRSLVLGEPPALTLFVSNTPRPREILRLLVTRPRTAAAVLAFGVTGIEPARKALRKGDLAGGAQAFGNAVFGRGGFGRLSASQRTQVTDNLTTVRAELLGSGFLPIDDDCVRRVEAPVLLVTGGRSIPLFRHLTNRLEELLPHTERVEIAGAGHMMHEDDPETYDAAVLDFLSRHPGP